MSEFNEILDNEFFILDSNNLDNVSTKLYGYSIKDGKLIRDVQESITLDGNGAYVYVNVGKDLIEISQDFYGSYGLYFFEKENYFAISNSFLKLVEYLKQENSLSLNEEFAKAFICADLCSFVYEKTLVNEIKVIPRNYEVFINISDSSVYFNEIDYDEHTIELNSKRGLDILDEWFEKWVNIIRKIKIKTNHLSIDLSGGFDSRIIILLVLNSNIDLDKIRIKSRNSNLHTYPEDFKIASKIASSFGFKLNNDLLYSKYEKKYFKDVQTPINISFYTKLGFHKQMYYKLYKSLNTKFVITGNGGETIRSYYDKTPNEFLEQVVDTSKYNDVSLIKPSVNAVKSTFLMLKDKFGNEYDDNSKELVDILYDEVRCRNHFGKQAVESYLVNCIYLSPLMDPLLHKLKLTTENCKDKNLLMAVIFLRYCPKLLDFDFEGNRKINAKTIQYANDINNISKFNLNYKDFISEPKNEIIVRDDVIPNKLYPFDVDEWLLELFSSKYFRLEFLKYFSENLYNNILFRAKHDKFFPLTDVYSSISIIKIIEDVKLSNNQSNNIFSDWINNYLKTITFNDFDFSFDLIQMLRQYSMGRVDLINKGSNNNSIKIMFNSDDLSSVSKPGWFKSEDGEGIVIESFYGSIDFKIRCINDGELNIFLRGPDIRDKNGKRFPIYIDFIKVTINGEDFLENPHLVWHDNPFLIKKIVKDSEIFHIHVEWLPFNRYSVYID